MFSEQIKLLQDNYSGSSDCPSEQSYLFRLTKANQNSSPALFTERSYLFRWTYIGAGLIVPEKIKGSSYYCPPYIL